MGELLRRQATSILLPSLREQVVLNYHHILHDEVLQRSSSTMADIEKTVVGSKVRVFYPNG